MCIRVVAFSIIVALSSMAIAATNQISNESIDKMLTYKTIAVIQLTGTATNNDSCTRSNAARYVAIDLINDKDIYTAALSAYMANRTVGFGTSGCMMWGDTSIPKAYRVDILKN